MMRGFLADYNQFEVLSTDPHMLGWISGKEHSADICWLHF